MPYVTPPKYLDTVIRAFVHRDNARWHRSRALNKRLYPSYAAVATQAALNFGVKVPELNTREFLNFKYTKKQDNMFNRAAAYDAMYKSLKSGTASGYGGEKQPADRQYAAYVRHSRSKFGHKKRYGIKRIKRELTEKDLTLVSRFHHFQNDGFANGLGGSICAYRTPNAQGDCGTFPFMIYDVTSLPCATAADGTQRGVFPIRQYQLAYQSINTADKDKNTFGWVPRYRAYESPSHMLNPFMDNYSVAVVTEQSGMARNISTFNPGGSGSVNCPYAEGFTHDWSDIQMVMYPQTTLPTKWHVALISFPDDLVKDIGASTMSTAGPCLSYVDQFADAITVKDTIGVEDCYDARRPVAPVQPRQSPDQNNLDNRWQAFWSGKLRNPINRDISGVGTLEPADNRLPFKIIKHESFIQPPRDNVAFGGNAQRLIKKLFYRRDWEFPPNRAMPQSYNANAMDEFRTVQARHQNVGQFSSPFPSSSEVVYLAVWCEHYKSTVIGSTIEALPGAAEYPGVAEFPSFDLMVRMKHRLKVKNTTYQSVTVKPDDAQSPPP